MSMPDEALGSRPSRAAQRSRSVRSMERARQEDSGSARVATVGPSCQAAGCTMRACGAARRRQLRVCTLRGTVTCDLTLVKQVLKLCLLFSQIEVELGYNIVSVSVMAEHTYTHTDELCILLQITLCGCTHSVLWARPIPCFKLQLTEASPGSGSERCQSRSCAPGPRPACLPRRLPSPPAASLHSRPGF